MSERFDVFVAHDPADADTAKTLCAALRRRGCRISAAALQQPGDLRDAVAADQRDSRMTVVVIGPGERDHYTHEAVARGIAHLREGRHTVVPLVLPGAAAVAVPYGLARVVRLDVGPSAGLEAAAQALADVLNVRPPAGQSELSPSTAATPSPALRAAVEAAAARSEPVASHRPRRWRWALALAVVGAGTALVIAAFIEPEAPVPTSADKPEAVPSTDRIEGGGSGASGGAGSGSGDIGGGGVGGTAGNGMHPKPAITPARPATDTKPLPAIVPRPPPQPPPHGPGSCDGTTCTLSSAAALAEHDRVCLAAPELTVRPTCTITLPGAAATCVRSDNFSDMPLPAITWSLCP